MMDDATIESLKARVATHVEALFSATARPDLVYHDLAHTKTVVARAEEIGTALGIPAREAAVLSVAAWFHDVGHLNGEAAGHEERSIAAAKDFLAQEHPDDPEFEAEVEGCIMATRIPQSPKNRLQEILCDADTYHFGTADFKTTNKQVKEEFTLRGHPELTEDWPQRTVNVLVSHRFFTPYAQEALSGQKADNLKKWEKKVAKEEKGEKEGKGKDKDKDKKGEKALTKEEKDDQKREQKKEEGLITRGIQTSLRLASENHLKLSDMADGKANILISVNSIIIGVILSVLLRRLEVDSYLTIPTMIFLASSVGTIVIAILATLPKVSGGHFSREDVVRQRTNLLFFGNFHRSTLADYSWAMDRLMRDKDYIYSTLVKDIYFLGVVLGKKYRLIRLAYYVFMFGLLASVVAFVWAISTNQPDAATQVVSPSRPPL